MKRKIKIMYLIWSMGDGGAQRIVLNYLRDFKNDPDLDVKLVVFSKCEQSYCDEAIKNEGYNVLYLNHPTSRLQIPYLRRFFNSMTISKIWEKVIKDFKPDIIHIHTSAMLQELVGVIDKLSVPVRFDTLHSHPSRYHGKQLKAIKKAFQNKNFIPICLNSQQVIEAKQYYGIKRYEIVHNGLDIADIKSKIIERKQARKLFDIDDEAFVVIGVGRLNKIKKYDLLINAFVNVKNPNAKLIIAGAGPEYDSLSKLVEQLGIIDKVKFVGNQNNIVPLYCAADVLCITSESESTSLVLLEAQVCNLRCVVSAGVPDESIVTNRVQKMKQNANFNEWATAIMNAHYKGKSFGNITDYDVHAVSSKIKQIYLKYWSEYCEK